VRALDPCPPGVLRFELDGLLPLPGGLDRLVVGLRPDRELAGGVFRPGARLAGRTDTTGGRIEADAHDGIAGNIPARSPLDTGMPLGTAGLFGLPIDQERA
jgi:hypothetical protein